MKHSWQITKRKLFRLAGKIFLYTTLLLIVALLGLTVWTQIVYLNIIRDAKERFHKNKVESLLTVATSDTISLSERNKSIWALGLLKDKAALPKLETMVTHQPCNHRHEVCQYELNKTILKIQRKYKGEIISSWVIR
jgi:membrane-anchored glycerophosphoryl diester phosphodiesterase (GDPDase)